MQLLKRFFNKNTVNLGIVGVGFLPDRITVAVTKFKDNNTLTLTHCESIDIGKPEDQLQTLKEFSKRYDLADYDCHVVLNTDNYRRINIESPNVAESELIEAIRWRISDFIDFPPENAVIDFYHTPMAVRANSTNMLEVTVSPIEIIQELAEKCNTAGLRLKVIDIQETTLRNLAAQMPENERGTALLYLLEHSCMLLIQKEGVIYVSRQFEIGYKKLGLDDEFSSEAPTAAAHNSLALEIQRSLDYVESYYGLPPIAVLAVIPLTKNTHNLLDSLSRHLGIATRVIDLTDFFDCDILVNNPTQSLCAPAIGATLRYSLIEP